MPPAPDCCRALPPRGMVEPKPVGRWRGRPARPWHPLVRADPEPLLRRRSEGPTAQPLQRMQIDGWRSPCPAVLAPAGPAIIAADATSTGGVASDARTEAAGAPAGSRELPCDALLHPMQEAGAAIGPGPPTIATDATSPGGVASNARVRPVRSAQAPRKPSAFHAVQRRGLGRSAGRRPVASDERNRPIWRPPGRQHGRHVHPMKQAPGLGSLGPADATGPGPRLSGPGRCDRPRASALWARPSGAGPPSLGSLGAAGRARRRSSPATPTRGFSPARRRPRLDGPPEGWNRRPIRAPHPQPRGPCPLIISTQRRQLASSWPTATSRPNRVRGSRRSRGSARSRSTISASSIRR